MGLKIFSNEKKPLSCNEKIMALQKNLEITDQNKIIIMNTFWTVGLLKDVQIIIIKFIDNLIYKEFEIGKLNIFNKHFDLDLPMNTLRFDRPQMKESIAQFDSLEQFPLPDNQMEKLQKISELIS